MRAAQTTLRRRPCCCPGGQNDRAESARERRTAARCGCLARCSWLATCRASGWGGAVFRRWGSSWRRITQKVPKMQRSQQFSGPEFSVSFLQLTAVFLCGFCVLGVGLLALLFAARGVFLGYCAASVAAVNGAAGLVQYRLETIASDAAALFLCLWLAGWSARLAGELFNAVCGRATRETPGTLRRLAVRFGAALVLSAVFSAVGTFLAFVTAKVGR